MIVNKYGSIAIESVKLCLNDLAISPSEAWECISIKYFKKGTSSQAKGCPRGAFLGLCQEGYIKHIPKGVYTSSNKNKQYAIDAVQALKREPTLANNKMSLWRHVSKDNSISHNSQMDVVIGLWESDLVIK